MMEYDPRSIAFLCDLAHAPKGADVRGVQKLHDAMFATGSPAYSSFAVTPMGPVLSNPQTRPGAVSQVTFLSGGLQFREELGGQTHETFAGRVRSIAAEAGARLGIECFLAQQVTIRSLINPRSYRDSREFLRDAMFRFGDEFDAFGRQPRLFGLRLGFLPEPDEPNAFALRIESYNPDPRSLFLENQGSFGGAAATGLDEIERRVVATYRFLEERVLPFVARFDARQEA